MSKTNLRRLQALERLPPSPAACRAALRRYKSTGEMPEHPGLKRIVERVIGAEREARELVTVVPPFKRD